jgi:adenylate cyclase
MQNIIGRWLGRVSVTVPLLIMLVCAYLAVKNPAAIDEFLEALLVDYRFKVRNFFSPPSAPENILIVAVDEKSLRQFGRWPWSRKLQAELIEKIFLHDPKVLAVDIFYPEAESPDSDRTLADVFEKHRGSIAVALGFEVEEGRKFQGEVEDVLFDQAIMKIENLSYLQKVGHVEAFRVLLPPEPIASSATFGHAYTLPDRDGKLRWEYPFVKYGDEYLPSFAVQTARIAKGSAPEDVRIVAGVGVDIGGDLIPTDKHGRLHLNYLGKERTFQYVSAADVLTGSIPEGSFKGKIVFLGTSAVAIYDIKVSPLSANFPGVEKNATVVANILGGNFIRKSPPYIDLVLVIAAGILVLLVSRQRSALRSMLTYALLIAVIIVAAQTVFSFFGFRMNLIYPLTTILSSGTFVISYRYFVEERKARDIRRMFSSYVTERVVNELIRNPDMARLGGERREITVLFSDIRGFTTFSEKNEPEDVVSMLNEYLGAMTEVIFRWEGTLDKFIGDAIVVFWGAPMAQENQAELSLRCALHMLKRLEELQQKWISEGKEPLDVGIGINSGEVLVGNIGAEGKKMDYTVIGDHVNLGARVESLTRKYDCRVLVTEFTFEKVRELIQKGSFGHLSIKGLEKVAVKGKEKPVTIYELKTFEPGCDSEIEECKDDRVVHMKEK